jgi:hypothetical protein
MYRIQEKISVHDSLIIKYKDERGTLVMITDDEDLVLGMEICKVIGSHGKHEWELWVSRR